MDSTERKDNAEDPFLPSHPSEPPSASTNSPTLISAGLKLDQNQIDEALNRARKKLTDEDFVQALSIVDTLLQVDPDLKTAKALREQIQDSASHHYRELFQQGVNCYMECDWDRARDFWKKSLEIVPDDPSALEWIANVDEKRELEKSIRSDLLGKLEQCGKMLSERNYVVAEENLEALKNKFTGGFRLADLQRIYEALLVRTRVELEKEFEDLRSNIIESPKSVDPAPQLVSEEEKVRQAQLQKQYMDAFEAGKKNFENGEWEKALAMWQTARQINPKDVNLIHWIALAENNIAHGPPTIKAARVRATIAFLSVFFLTTVITYFGYQKYAEYSKQSKNRALIQRSIEHYRAGRLEESWKTLQLYVLQDPDNETARTLLERVTSEMNAREKMKAQDDEKDAHLQNGREQKTYQENNPVNSSEKDQGISALKQEGEVLLGQHQLDQAAEKFREILNLRPADASAKTLLNKVESERTQLNRVAAQLEVARYLYERNQKASSVLVLNRILETNPQQPHAKQLLARIRGSSPTPKALLEIRIQPSARLWIDGRDLGFNSHFHHMESVGLHIIHIELQGFRNQDLGIEVKGSAKNQFQFQLKPL